MTFILSMAWRETRGAWRHFLYFFVCIAVGVGALVGVGLFAYSTSAVSFSGATVLLEGNADFEIVRLHATLFRPAARPSGLIVP